MRKLFATLGFLLFGAIAAMAVNIPLVSGPQEVNQMNAVINGVIRNINSGVTPQSVASFGEQRNLLDNGAFNVYPVGATNKYTAASVSATLTGINTTSTYHAGRWFVYANTGAASAQVANVTTNLPLGYQNGEQFGRTSGNASLQLICLAQIIPAERAVTMQGQQITVSFNALAGATFSAASSQVSVWVTTGTTADEGAATLLSGWTGVAQAAGASGTLTTISATNTRYSVTSGVIGSTVKEAAIQICYTPVGTAGATDNVVVSGVQAEVGTSASSFEFRPLAIDQYAVARRVQAIADGAATARYAPGVVTSTNTVSHYVVPLTVTMAAVPTIFVQTAASFAAGSLADPPAATNCTTLATVASSATVSAFGLKCTAGALTASTPTYLMGQATGAFVLAFAEL